MSTEQAPIDFDVCLARANTDGWIEVTYSELQLFAEQYTAHFFNRPGVVTMPFEQFCTAQDLENWRQLFAWWPRVSARAVPPPFAPTLTLMLDARHGAPALPPAPFATVLRQHWERAVAWCQQHGVSPTDPNESTEERKRRLNRERVAAWRAKQRAEADPATAQAVVTAKQALAQAVADVKAQFAPRVEDANKRVAEAHAWFLKVSRERKALLGERDDALAACKAAHDNGPVDRPADAPSIVDHS